MNGILATALGIFLTTFLNTMLKPLTDLAISTGYLDIETYSIMSRYCEDLTKSAEEGKLHDVIGRDKELDSLMDVLSRKGKCNPCIIGEAGVGKTALIEGLAYRISKGLVPDSFKNKKIIKVNMVELIAGRSYSGGSPVGRMRSLFDKAKEDKDMILFIDEFHQIVNCGAAELFKVYLDRGEVSVIAATTTREYSFISKDPALERRFTNIFLSEPTRSETLQILKNLKCNIEKDKKIKISDEALSAAVELSGRYIKRRTYPDKAIDVTLSTIEMAIRKNRDENNLQKIEEITEKEIREYLTLETGIPLREITPEEAKILKGINSRIKQDVVGQDEAVDKTCEAILRSRVGLVSDGHPRSSFLFLGPHGVGKTLLAEAIGEEIGSIIRVNMAQYSEKNSKKSLVKNKISSYKSEVVRKITERPYSVVLFDGIEKAHKNVINLLIEILEKGYILDSDGGKVDFSNSIIIITSSIGSEIFNSNDNIPFNELKKKVIDKAESILGNELIRRIDSNIVFRKMDVKYFSKLTDMITANLENELSSQGIHLEIEDELKNYISKIDEDENLGVRRLKKEIEKKIEMPIADLIVKGEIKRDNMVKCYISEGNIKFEIS